MGMGGAMRGMTQTAKAHRLVAMATMVVAVLLAGCSEDPEAEPSLGAVERTGSVTAADLVLVTNGEGVARLVGTLVNEAEDSDRLVGIDLQTEVGEYSVILAQAPVVLPTGEPVRLARDAEVTVLSDTLKPGFRADLRLSFRNSASISTTVPVNLPEGIYSDVEVLDPDAGLSPK